MNKSIQDLKLPIAILGLGKTGLSILKLLRLLEVPENKIFTFDENSKQHSLALSDFLIKAKPATLIVSPGVPLSRPEIASELSRGVDLTSELEIAFRFLKDEKVICVTGSLGKSTVTSIIGAGIKKIDKDVFVGGNLGIPLADYILDLLQAQRAKAKYVVLELSSYQLENFKNLKSNVSALTYLAPNHLERYRDLEHYYKTKLTLIDKTKGEFIVNRNGGDNLKYISESTKFKFVDRKNLPSESKFYRPPGLIGSHNRDNLAVSFAVFDYLKLSEEAYAGAWDFAGLDHRLENLGEKFGVIFINDSKATTMDSSLQACYCIREYFPEKKLKVLLGGKDKNMPWQELKKLQALSSTQFYFFGEVAQKARTLSELKGEIFPTLKSCLKGLETNLEAGDVLLLSPGGTSLDEFKSFEDRGDYFKNWVKSFNI
jgi:UDP-N-acetylmuramoylalanine--D-glutamate ligase